MNVRTKLDSDLIPTAGHVVRHLALHLQAPARRSTERPDLDLSLVVDRSGSMCGRPLEAARESALLVTGLLDPNDRLAVVDFGSSAFLTLPPTRMTPQGRAYAERAIAGIECDGYTDLHDGWRLGVEAFEFLGRETGAGRRSRRVVVLSDGMGNTGVTAPTLLARAAAATFEAGVVTSSVGFGDRYSTEQLEALALHGGGRLLHASHPERIADRLTREFEAATETAADRIVVRLWLPPGLRATCLNSCPRRSDGGWVAGALLAGSTRDLVFRLEGRLGQVGDTPPVVQWAVRYEDPTEPEEPVRLAGTVDLRLTDADDPRLEDLDPEVAGIVARAERFQACREAFALYERGDRHEAGRVLERRAERLREWSDHPEVCGEAGRLHAYQRMCLHEEIDPLEVKALRAKAIAEQDDDSADDETDSEATRPTDRAEA